MVRAKTHYVCSECGGASPKWSGQCPHCSAWNTLQEQAIEAARGSPAAHRFAPLAATQGVQWLDAVVAAEVPRFPTGAEEFDRVLGGGLVPGSVVLIGGDPGHRQVHPAAAGPGASVAIAARALCQRRRISGPGGSACTSPGAGRQQSAAASRNWARAHCGRHRVGIAQGRGGRFDPNALHRAVELSTRLGGTGARLRRATDAAGQADRRHDRDDRSRDQGGHAGRAARATAAAVSACSAPSRTASVRSTSWACLP